MNLDKIIKIEILESKLHNNNLSNEERLGILREIAELKYDMKGLSFLKRDLKLFSMLFMFVVYLMICLRIVLYW